MDDSRQETIVALAAIFGNRVSTGSSVLEMHSRDEGHVTPVLPDAVVFPLSTEEVSTIVKICAAHKCPIIPFGIGTSLEGHVVPVHGGISIDLSQMNSILEIHEEDLDAVVQPGVLSDECELVSARTMKPPVMPHRVDATQQERRFG